MTSFKLKKIYKAAYANPASKDFVKVATEIEDVLLVVLQKKNSKIVAVQVTKITKGSLVVDFNVIMSSSAPTAKAVESSLKSAITNGDLSSISPDKTATFSAQGLFVL